LKLCFEPNRLRVNRQDPPWKVVRAFRQPGAGVLVHLNNVSGGVLAGDRLALDVTVHAGAIAQITTTGATRLYRHRAGSADSEQVLTFSVGENARLEYLPDPLIPYSGSRHTQRTKIRLESGAALFWWETLAPGRQASGESFAFERLRIESEVRLKIERTRSRPLLREDFLLEPAKRPLAVTARMREYSYVSSLYVCQDGRPASFWRALEDELNDAAAHRTRRSEAIWGASTLVSDGVMVRGLSASHRFIPAALTDFWRLTRRAVTGEDPVPPRKIY
jgi:urease accessory protein